MARLGDYIKQVRGVSYKPEDVCDSSTIDSVPILRANNIQDNGLNFHDLVYVKKARVSKEQMIKAGDIVICTSSGSKNLVGKAAVAKEDLQISFGAFCKVVRTSRMSAEYLGYFFQSPAYRSRIAEVAGGANINNIRNEHIDDLSFPLINQEKQNEAIAVLDKVTDLISLRKQQIAKLDELVKSQFIEMFGDKGFPKETMNSLCKLITDGTHQPPKFVDTGIPFLFVSNLISDKITYNAEKFISLQTYKELIRRTPIELGDILLTTVGSYGHPAIVVEETQFCFQRHIAYMKPKQELINSKYLHSALLMPDVKNQIEAKVKGIAQKTLNLSELKSIEITTPPMDLQNQFAAFVQQVDKSKFEIQKSLEKLETLKKALMQQYFG